MTTKINSAIIEVHLFNHPQNSLKKISSHQSASPGVGLRSFFATFLSLCAPILKDSIGAAPGAALEPANNGTVITILDILSPTDRTKSSLFSQHVV